MPYSASTLQVAYCLQFKYKGEIYDKLVNGNLTMYPLTRIHLANGCQEHTSVGRRLQGIAESRTFESRSERFGNFHLVFRIWHCRYDH